MSAQINSSNLIFGTRSPRKRRLLRFTFQLWTGEKVKRKWRKRSRNEKREETKNMERLLKKRLIQSRLILLLISRASVHSPYLCPFVFFFFLRGVAFALRIKGKRCLAVSFFYSFFLPGRCNIHKPTHLGNSKTKRSRRPQARNFPLLVAAR